MRICSRLRPKAERTPTTYAMLPQGTGDRTSGTVLVAASLQMAPALQDGGRTMAGCSQRRTQHAAASHQSACHCGRQLAMTAASPSRWMAARDVSTGRCNAECIRSHHSPNHNDCYHMQGNIGSTRVVSRKNRPSSTRSCCAVQARDDLGNKRLTGGDDFVAQLRGPSTVYATIEDAGNGTYGVTLNTTTAGDHLLHVTAGQYAAHGGYMNHDVQG